MFGISKELLAISAVRINEQRTLVGRKRSLRRQVRGARCGRQKSSYDFCPRNVGSLGRSSRAAVAPMSAMWTASS
jgi:hypothetical protein